MTPTTFLKYKIYECEDDGFGEKIKTPVPEYDAVLTQDGKVAWWDDSAGWAVDEDQSKFVVEMGR